MPGVEDLDGMPIINLSEPPIRGWNWAVKRIMDIAVSVGASRAPGNSRSASSRSLIKLTSKGSVFYTQERAGLDNKPFTIYKFRSMFDDAEKESRAGVGRLRRSETHRVRAVSSAGSASTSSRSS